MNVEWLSRRGREEFNEVKKCRLKSVLLDVDEGRGGMCVDATWVVQICVTER